MADYGVALSEALLPGLLIGRDGLAKLIQGALNQVLDAQMAEHLGAERYERTEERDGRYRNGHRERQLPTCLNSIAVRGPERNSLP